MLRDPLLPILDILLLSACHQDWLYDAAAVKKFGSCRRRYSLHEESEVDRDVNGQLFKVLPGRIELDVLLACAPVGMVYVADASVDAGESTFVLMFTPVLLLACFVAVVVVDAVGWLISAAAAAFEYRLLGFAGRTGWHVDEICVALTDL